MTRCSESGRCLRFAGAGGRRAWPNVSLVWPVCLHRYVMDKGTLWLLCRFPAPSTEWAAAPAPAGPPICSPPPTPCTTGSDPPLPTHPLGFALGVFSLDIHFGLFPLPSAMPQARLLPYG